MNVYVLYLSFFEGLSGQEAPAGRLERRDVLSGVFISLNFEFSHCSSSEEHLTHNHKVYNKRCFYKLQV